MNELIAIRFNKSFIFYLQFLFILYDLFVVVVGRSFWFMSRLAAAGVIIIR